MGQFMQPKRTLKVLGPVGHYSCQSCQCHRENCYFFVQKMPALLLPFRSAFMRLWALR
jgi:hypothetical protein